MAQSTNGFWKWVAGLLAAVLCTNFATAWAFRTSDDDISKVLKDKFTAMSGEHSMYAIEGRRRIETVESAMTHIGNEMHGMNVRLSAIQTTLDHMQDDHP